jgi:hypothetical protein
MAASIEFDGSRLVEVSFFGSVVMNWPVVACEEKAQAD